MLFMFVQQEEVIIFLIQQLYIEREGTLFDWDSVVLLETLGESNS